MTEPIRIDVEPDQARIFADELELWCTCDVPSPIFTPGTDGPECATCRRAIVS